MEFITLLKTLQRRRKLFLIIFAAFFLATILASELTTPIYRVSAKVLIYKGNSAMQAAFQGLGLVGTSAQVLQADSSSDTIDTDIQLALTRPLVNEVITSLEIKNSKGKLVDYEDITTGFLLKMLRPKPHLKADQYEDAGIIELIAYSKDPAQAAAMANKMSELYNQQNIDRIKKEYGKAHQFVDEQIAEVTKRFQDSLAAQRDFRLRENAFNTTTQTTNILTIMNNIIDKLDTNERDRLVNAEKLKLAKKKIADINPMWASSEMLGINSDASTLRAQIRDMIVQMKEKSQTITSEHEDYKILEAKLKELKSLISSENDLTVTQRSYTFDPKFEDVYKSIVSLSLELDAAELRSAALRNDYQKHLQRLKEIPETEMQQAKYTVDTEVTQTLYNKLVTLKGVLIVVERNTASSLRVVEPAQPPTRKYFPKRKYTYSFGFLMGLLLAFAVVLIAEYTDKSLKDPSDMKALRATFLGAIIKDSSGVAEAAQRAPGPGTQQGGVSDESMRATCSAALNESKKLGSKVIAVCSVAPFEGRTLVAANLALFASRTGHKTLLVDLDLRRQSLAKTLGLTGMGGFEAYASGADLSACVQKAADDLNVLYGYNGADDPSIVIDKGIATRISADALNEYDIVIVDTPALVAYNDAAVIAGQCGSAIFVAESNRCTVGFALNALSRIESFGARIVGTVLNKFDGSGLLYDPDSLGFSSFSLWERIKTRR